MVFKAILLCSFYLSLSLLSVGQATEAVKLKKRGKSYREGYIVTLESDTIEGFIKHKKQKTARYESVIFVDNNSFEFTFSPSEVLGYSYDEYTFITIDDKLYELLVDGEKAQLLLNSYFKYNYVAPGQRNQGNRIDQKYLRQSNSLYPKLIEKSKFYYRARSFFSDCPQIVMKVENKEYLYQDLAEMVIEYNSCDTDE